MAELANGDWVLGEPLGRGAGTVVHRGHHRLHPDRAVAIKRVVPDAAASGAVDPAAVDMLRHEARVLAQLAHPAIIPFTDIVADGSGVALVMPLAPAGSLAARIRSRGALPWREVADLGARLAGALAAAHTAGIIHRDVTPGNVLYGRELEPRLADFGAAIIEGDDHHVVGTPGYLDPETARGGPAGPTGDVYGLGVVLYEALAGQPPFAGATPEAVLRSADRGVHLPLAALVPEAPAELATVVERAMARDPADRHAGAQQLQVALEHVVLTAPDQGEEVPGLMPPAVALPPPAILPGASQHTGDPAGPTGANAPPDASSDDTVAVSSPQDIGAVSLGDHEGDLLPPTTDFGPRPIAPLDIEEPRRPWWMVAALIAVVVLPLGVAAWALLANRVDDALPLGAEPTSTATSAGSASSPTAAATTAPEQPSAPAAPPTTRPSPSTPVAPATPAPAPTTPGPSGVEFVPRVPAPLCDGVDPSAADGLQADVDGRGCSLPITVTPGPKSTILGLPAEAGPLAGDYRLEGPPVDVVVGDWDGDGVDTPAITVDATGVVFAFEAWGAGQSAAIGEPIGAADPLVVTDPDGLDRVIPDERA